MVVTPLPQHFPLQTSAPPFARTTLLCWQQGSDTGWQERAAGTLRVQKSNGWSNIPGLEPDTVPQNPWDPEQQAQP